MTEVEKVPVGLFDFNDYWEIVGAVSEVLELPRDEVQERLFNEAIETGWNTVRAAREFGITPHVFDERMEEFFQQTDSFVIELLISHLSHFCQEIDRRVAKTVELLFDDPEDVEILSLGDGIGTDSLRFAVAGYRVTHFDFDGYSASFAQQRFRRQGMQEEINMLHRLDKIPIEAFDVVICREVLEHVQDPPEVIKDIWRYLRQEGIAIITESFSRIEPAFPTHLAKNQKYHGQTERLFVRAGFRLLKSFSGRRPMVFRKTTKPDKSRFETLNQGSSIQLKFKKFGKRIIRMILL